MKIRRVLANPKKKCFVIASAAASYEFPFCNLTIKPSTKDPLVSVGVDKELGNEGFTYTLKSGASDTVTIDQVLKLNSDPSYLREEILFELSCDAQEYLEDTGISKRALARRLGVSPAQLYRLLDQKFYGKSIDQMVRLLHALGHKVEISTKAVA